MPGLTGSRLPGDIAVTMTDRPHNVASEFARAVLASGLRRHFESLEGTMYNTVFERAIRALKLERFERPLIRNWRRGRAKPRSWAIQMLRNQLEQDAELLYEIAEQLRHEVGPGHGGCAETLHRWRAQQAAEKEKGAEAPSTVNREP